MDVAGVVHRRSLRLPGRPGEGRPVPRQDGSSTCRFMVEAVSRLATRRYDVVHAVEEAAHLIAPVARLLGVPLVTDVDSSIPDQLRYSGFATRGPAPLGGRGARTPRAAALRRRGDGVREPHGRRTAPRPGGAASSRSRTRPSSTGRRLARRGATRLRASLGLGSWPGRPLLGELRALSGRGAVLEAAAHVPDAQFLFMGGSAADEARIEARPGPAARARAASSPASVPPRSCPSFLALADVLASPRAKGENTPFKVYTYLASGKPLVATRIRRTPSSSTTRSRSWWSRRRRASPRASAPSSDSPRPRAARAAAASSSRRSTASRATGRRCERLRSGQRLAARSSERAGRAGSA